MGLRVRTNKIVSGIVKAAKPKLGIKTGKKKPLISVALRGKPRQKKIKFTY